MSETLQWTLQDKHLVLSGELGSDTLMPLWQARADVVADITHIDLGALQRVDTAGLALLIHLVDLARHHRGAAPVLSGGDDNLRTLAKLYNLPPELLSFDAA